MQKALLTMDLSRARGTQVAAQMGVCRAGLYRLLEVDGVTLGALVSQERLRRYYRDPHRTSRELSEDLGLSLHGLYAWFEREFGIKWSAEDLGKWRGKRY